MWQTGKQFSLEHRRKLSEKGKGRKLSLKSRMKLSRDRLGVNNPMWKGDNVKYSPLHDYIRCHKPKPNKCELCGKITNKLDLANISQKYLRDVNDFEWLCRSCHMKKDGRLDKVTRFMKDRVQHHRLVTIQEIKN